MDELINVSDNLKLVTIKSSDIKKALILRVGGVGDCLILTPVARTLYNQGYKVDYMSGSPTGNVHKLFDGLPFINQSLRIERVNGIDCVKDKNEHYISVEILKENYDEVFDYKYSVEDNRSGVNKTGGWRNTLNSNYMNWIDLSLAWANIDYTKVSDENKKPEIVIEPKYLEWILTTSIGDKKAGGARICNIIGIQLQASTLIRSWYKAGDLPKIIHEKYPNDLVVIFMNGIWKVLSKYGEGRLVPDEFKPDDTEFDPLLISAAIISQMDCFITADSGMSHVAAALDIPTIGIYTTVPAWTREKYYSHSFPLETNVYCHPCFTLDAFCPIEKENALKQLTEREKQIIDCHDKGMNIVEVCRKFNSIPGAIQAELNAARQRVQALSAVEAACVKSITSDMILEKLDMILLPNKINSTSTELMEVL